MRDPQHNQLSQHQFESMLKPEDVMSLFEDNPYLNAYGETVENPAMAEINREMIPLLAEMLTLGPKNHDHPTVKQLFNWLVDPQRTGEEFHYVIGPLQLYVTDIMMEHFEEYVYEYDGYSIYLGKSAAEALAVKCPVLKGPWEHIAWLLVKETVIYHDTKYGPASDCFSAWITNVIGNADICSNPYLRFELIHVLDTRVNYEKFNQNERTKVLESVLSACSFLTMDYQLDINEKSGLFRQTDLFCINQTFRKCINDEHMLDFDVDLALKLKHIQTSRLSSVIHSSLSLSSIHYDSCNQPIEFQGLTALLKSVSGCAMNHITSFNSRNWLILGGIQPLFAEIHQICVALRLLISKFPKSFQTNQLIEQAASCLLNLMKTFMLINSEIKRYGLDPDNLYDVRRLLKIILDDNCMIPIVQYITCHEYQGPFEREISQSQYFQCIV